jgi:tryptophan synthase alpha chain
LHLTAVASLGDVFARARSRGRAALIVYLVAGDPDVDTTERVIDALCEAGVDLIELGIPYGDPLADGPTIAAAAHRALTAGTTVLDVMAIAKRARARSSAPIVYFTYANPVDRMGIARFADAAAASGALGALVPDLPLEETAELRSELDARGLALPLFVAPTTPLERSRTIVAASRGFVYVVSRLGVTGARRSPDFAATADRVAELRRSTALPFGVGFGISSAADVQAVAAFADGVIIGSALIDAYAGATGADAATKAAQYVASLRT